MTVAKLFNLRWHLQEVTCFPGAATVLPITRPFTNHYENFVLVKGLCGVRFTLGTTLRVIYACRLSYVHLCLIAMARVG